jgi:hypothetical protein
MKKMDIRKFARAAAAALIASPFMTVAARAGQPATALDFHNTVTGEPLKLDEALPEGGDTEAVKQFFATGHNPSCFPSGKDHYLTAWAAMANMRKASSGQILATTIGRIPSIRRTSACSLPCSAAPMA